MLIAISSVPALLRRRERHLDRSLRRDRGVQRGVTRRAAERPARLGVPRVEHQAGRANGLDRGAVRGLPPQQGQLGLLGVLIGRKEVEPDVDLLGLGLGGGVSFDRVEQRREAATVGVAHECGGLRGEGLPGLVRLVLPPQARGERGAERFGERHDDRRHSFGSAEPVQRGGELGAEGAEAPVRRVPAALGQALAEMRRQPRRDAM